MRAGVLLLGLSVLLPACESSKKPGEPGQVRERTNAVKSTTSTATLVDELCDEQPQTAFTPPKLSGGATFPTVKGWHWINVWATWCEPCVEEMPRLAAWNDEWRKEGADLQLSFLSADTDPEAIAAFAATHPEAQGGLQLSDLDEAKAWLGRVGVDNMSLPVHVFVDGAGKVQCVRASSIEDGDKRAVHALLHE